MVQPKAEPRHHDQHTTRNVHCNEVVIKFTADMQIDPDAGSLLRARNRLELHLAPACRYTLLPGSLNATGTPTHLSNIQLKRNDIKSMTK